MKLGKSLKPTEKIRKKFLCDLDPLIFKNVKYDLKFRLSVTDKLWTTLQNQIALIAPFYEGDK